MKLEIKDKLEHPASLKVAPFRKEIRNTNPHKHNAYLEIIYLFQGTGVHTIDAVQYSIASPIVFIVRKEQVHHWELTSEPSGYVLIIKKTFIDNCLDGEIGGLVSHLSRFSSVQIEDVAMLNCLFEMLVREHSATTCNKSIVSGLLKAILAKVVGSAVPATNNRELPHDLFLSFRELLSQNTELWNSVAFYARKLNTSPQNLNAACQKAVAQSASMVLSDYLMREAKRLLIYTTKTVSEIADMFGFNDASHFIKYFKRHSDKTPQQYRKNC